MIKVSIILFALRALAGPVLRQDRALDLEAQAFGPPVPYPAHL